MEKYLENAKTILFEYGPNVLYALGLLIIGLFLIKKLGGTLMRLTRASGLQLRQVQIYSFIEPGSAEK